jgi:signal transduction histidine kinase
MKQFAFKKRIISLLLTVVGVATLFPIAWSSYSAVKDIEQNRIEKTNNLVLMYGKPVGEAIIKSDSISLSKLVMRACKNTKSVSCSVLSNDGEVIFSYPFNLGKNTTYTYSERPVIYSGKKTGSFRIFWPNKSILSEIINNTWPLLLFSLLLIGATFIVSRALLGQTYADLKKLFKSQEGESLENILDNMASIESPVIEISKLTNDMKNRLTAIVEFEKDKKENEKARVIANTTKMLAHDVRKPFTLLNIILNDLASATSRDRQQIASDYLPEVKQAIVSVNAMLSDIMNNNSVGSIDAKSTNLTELVKENIDTCLKQYDSEVNVSYSLEHANNVVIDGLKVSRVFINIFSNALEATNAKGELWIKTCESAGQTRITIGNSGSFIRPENIDNVFKSYFTKDKVHGTGLGLAISRKIIEAHDCKIWCTSSAQNGTEFHFTLPQCTISESQNQVALESMNNITAPTTPSFESKKEKIATKKGHLIVVDDNEFILCNWASLEDLQKIKTYHSPEQFWTDVKKDSSILEEANGIVTDYFFDGRSQINGIKFADELRTAGYEKNIFLSSDGDFKESDFVKSKMISISKNPQEGYDQIAKINS